MTNFTFSLSLALLAFLTFFFLSFQILWTADWLINVFVRWESKLPPSKRLHPNGDSYPLWWSDTLEQNWSVHDDHVFTSGNDSDVQKQESGSHPQQPVPWPYRLITYLLLDPRLLSWTRVTVPAFCKAKFLSFYITDSWDWAVLSVVAAHEALQCLAASLTSACYVSIVLGTQLLQPKLTPNIWMSPEVQNHPWPYRQSHTSCSLY